MTITHPHHPLCGQQVTLVRIRRRSGPGPDPDLIVRHPDGYHAAIRMSWTDFGAPRPSSAVDPPLLELAGLRQAAQLLERIRQDGRWPPLPALPAPLDSSYDLE